MTNKEKLVKKLTSRKFIIAAITAIAGLITLFVGDNEVVQIIAGAAMTIVPTVVYCIMEGVVDAASVKTVADATAEAAEKLGASDVAVNAIENAGNLAAIVTEDEDAPEGADDEGEG